MSLNNRRVLRSIENLIDEVYDDANLYIDVVESLFEARNTIIRRMLRESETLRTSTPQHLTGNR